MVTLSFLVPSVSSMSSMSFVSSFSFDSSEFSESFDASEAFYCSSDFLDILLEAFSSLLAHSSGVLESLLANPPFPSSAK